MRAFFCSMLGLMLSFGLACTNAPSDDTPSGAIRLFLAAMDESRDDPSARARAYKLLAQADRRELQTRSELATALAGREFPPWEMIAPDRYRLRFTPAPGARGMREKIEGEHAVVTVTGSKSDQRAEVVVVHEADGWRVVLGLAPAGDTGATQPSP